MKKLILTVSLVLISCLAAHAQQSVTLSTYYPAPFGSYDRLRLVPRVNEPPCDASLEGLMYYSDDPDNFIKICHSDGTFRTLAGVWTQDNATNSIYPSETPTNPNLKVGIGTTSPQVQLHLSGNGGEAGELILENTAAGSSVGIKFIVPTDTTTYSINSSNNRLTFNTTDHATGAHARPLVLKPNGNFGIGTTDPQDRLHVVGDALRIEDGSPEIFIIDQDDTYDWRIKGNHSNFRISSSDDNDPHNSATWDERFFIDGATGGVGIGTRGATINDLLVLGPYPHPADEGAEMNIRTASNVQWAGSILHFSRTRGVPGGASSPVLPGDVVGAISSWANTGGLGARIAAITMEVDAAGTVNPTSSPGRLLFKTTPNGAMQPTTRMLIDKDGNVGINMLPNYTLDVHGTIHADGGDLAENILVEAGVGPGDVVVIAEDDDKKLKKTDRPYDPTIAGVISTDPGFCLAEKKEGYQPLALTGQVPVKATTENGPIKRGDLLTSSSKPGYAMKAEFISLENVPLPELAASLEENRKRQLAIIGKALEELAEGEGTIVILMAR